MPGHRHFLRVWGSALILSALAASVRAALPVIYTNTSNLLPNTANQTLQIYVTGTDVIQGEALNFQILSGNTGPIFTGVDTLAGTIFAGGVQTAPDTNNFNTQFICITGTLSGHLAAVNTTTNGTASTIDNGLLAKLTLSTVGATSGTFTLNMLNTLNGASLLIPSGTTGSTIGLTYLHNQFSIGTAARQWKLNGGGAWGTDSNWTPFAPYASADIANFSTSLTSGTAAITLDGARTVGTVNFSDTAGSYDLQTGAGGQLWLDNGSQSPLIASLAGKHSISAPVILTANTNLSVVGGSTLTLSGGISGTISSSSLALTGAGKLILTGANSYTATNIAAGSTLQVGNGTASGTLGTATITNSGTLILANVSSPLAVPLSGSGAVQVTGLVVFTNTSTNESWSITSPGTLQVGNGGTAGLLSDGAVSNAGNLTFYRSDAVAQTAQITGAGTLTQSGTGTTTLTAYQGTGAIHVTNGMLQLATTNGARRTSAVLVQSNGIAVTNGAGVSVLDLTNNDLMITNTTYATVQTLVTNGMNPVLGHGSPTGPQITSSTAVALANSNYPTVLTAFEMDRTWGSGNYGDGSAIGFSDPGFTDGVTVTQPGTVMVKYGYFGDIAFTGSVSPIDLGNLLGNLGITTPGAADIGLSYVLGDLNGDGTVNPIDLGLMLGVLGAGSGGSFGNPLDVTLGSPALAPSGGTSAVPEPATLFLLGLGILFLLKNRRRFSEPVITPFVTKE